MPKGEFAELIAKSRTCGDVLQHFGFNRSGNNWHTVRNRCNAEGISFSHFNGEAMQREALLRMNKAAPLEEVMVKNSTYSRGSLKSRLLKAGILKNQCEVCGLGGEWNGKPLRMRLDHSNGIHNDHRQENLRMICPNCDSQQETYSGGNRKRVKRNNCADCGREVFWKHSTRCRRCQGKHRLVTGQYARAKWPSNAGLLAEVQKTSKCAVARRLGVSETAVRCRLKRIEKYRLLV
jgi:Zn finger protein HypA/HybF involved in hydrogenase expression